MIAPIGLALLLLSAPPAGAHGALAGGGGFYAGAAHPFLAADHLLALAAFGLLLGRASRRSAGPAMAALAVALLGGLALASAGEGSSGASLALLATTVLTGGLVALAAPVPPLGAAAITALGGLAIGLTTDVPPFDWPADASGLVTYALPFAGVLVGVFLIALNVMALATAARRPPFTVGVRIAGSWAAAAALMAFALQIRRIGGA